MKTSPVVQKLERKLLAATTAKQRLEKESARFRLALRDMVAIWDKRGSSSWCPVEVVRLNEIRKISEE